MSLRSVMGGRSKLPIEKQHPRDLDNPGFMESLARQLENAGAEPLPPERQLPPNDFAPKRMRIEEAIMEGNEELKVKISSTLEDVRKVVKDEIAEMRKELDDLERVIDESCDAARRNMENALNIAAHSLAAANDIRAKISGFRETVKNTIPDAEDQSEENLRK